MMRARITFLVIVVSGMHAFPQVAEMNWELDYEVYLKMSNDSGYHVDIRDLFHITDIKSTDFTSEFVFYPVYPGIEFAQQARPDSSGSVYSTLWSALHARLGGGWIHFINCIAYALETKVLDLQEPIMKRPDTRWKPNPVTETWKRTHTWEYYIPLSQNKAKKEYKIRLHAGQTGDLENLPASYINLFLSTSDKEYRQMRAEGNYKEAAKIDLVRIMLGANYLGEDQINYVSNAVLNAVTSYSSAKLPSVLIFDEFDAAAAMNLDASGYVLESLVFSKSAGLSDAEMGARKKEILKILDTINQYNQEAFKKRLGNYYTL